MKACDVGTGSVMLWQPFAADLVLTGAGGTGGGLQHLRGHEVDLGVVGGLDAAFNPKHFPNGVLVPVADFKLFPGLPEVRRHLEAIPVMNEPELSDACASLY